MLTHFVPPRRRPFRGRGNHALWAHDSFSGRARRSRGARIDYQEVIACSNVYTSGAVSSRRLKWQSSRPFSEESRLRAVRSAMATLL